MARISRLGRRDVSDAVGQIYDTSDNAAVYQSGDVLLQSLQ